MEEGEVGGAEEKVGGPAGKQHPPWKKIRLIWLWHNIPPGSIVMIIMTMTHDEDKVDDDVNFEIHLR